jgi:hypothetical protein
MEQLKSAILNCLQNLKGSGKFASIHTADFVFPGLQVDAVGEISFPLNEQQAKDLIQVAHKAPFGKGSKTILDADVRSAWEIDAAKLSFNNPQWKSFLSNVVKKVKKDLGLENHVVEAHLYKLLIYEEGDFFLTHKDSEKEKGMFASLVVGLPAKYTGGELVISFEGEQVMADFAENANDYSINCAAFYADCDHEVKRLTSGYRICLIYNLTQQQAAEKIELQSLNSYADTLAQTFVQNPLEQPYIILLGHQYTPENFAYNTLKLNDRYKADALIKAAKNLGYYAKMCLVTSYISGAPAYDGYYGDEEGDEDAVMEEVYEESLNVEHWVESELPALDNLQFEEQDLIASFALDEDEPIVKESTGYMGNYGPDLMHWYHYGAVVIWPPEQNAKLLLTQGTATKLQWIAYFNRTKKVTKTEADAVNNVLLTGLDTKSYSDIKPEFNVIADWLIQQNDTTFLLSANKAQLQLLFKKIDTVHWQKILEWQPKEISRQLFEKLTSDLNQPVVEKLLSVIRMMASSPTIAELAVKQTAGLPLYINVLNQKPPVQFKAEALADLFWIENHFSPGEEWIEKISQILISNTDWQYIHHVLTPQLLAEKASSKVQYKMLRFCKEYLQQRVDNKPQPPANWSRMMPDNPGNRQVWKMLQTFMESPVEQFMDFRKNEKERSVVEYAIKAEVADLRTETIKKGSPHILRITKTKADYEQQMKNWHKDVALLEKALSKML